MCATFTTCEACRSRPDCPYSLRTLSSTTPASTTDTSGRCWTNSSTASPPTSTSSTPPSSSRPQLTPNTSMTPTPEPKAAHPLPSSSPAAVRDHQLQLHVRIAPSAFYDEGAADGIADQLTDMVGLDAVKDLVALPTRERPAPNRGVRQATARIRHETARAVAAPAMASVAGTGRSCAPPTPWAGTST